MSRPESEHVTSLRAFRDKLVEARRAIAKSDDIDGAVRRFLEVQSAIGLLDKAIENELDLTPLPHIDDPTTPAPFPDSDKGPPLIETL
jgi:hypothetical protein